MNITLNPKLENLIKQQITSAKYTSINDVIEEALTLLETRNQYYQWVKEIVQKIDIAAQQLYQGEGIDGKTAINQVREHLRETNEWQ
ncbi:MAG: type II toxin-antitoxin system ParD family antitoxin [Moorea sp. SIO2B7]|nr:type II toxin-antitoxin system ParD family antitoxin [Moorena sp. SIO2B7]